jgi:hypothetical protein
MRRYTHHALKPLQQAMDVLPSFNEEAEEPTQKKQP